MSECKAGAIPSPPNPQPQAPHDSHVGGEAKGPLLGPRPSSCPRVPVRILNCTSSLLWKRRSCPGCTQFRDRMHLVACHVLHEGKPPHRN